MDLELSSRRAVVTGGSRGIGLAVGRALAAEGAAVALVARDAGAVARAAGSLAAPAGQRVVVIAADTMSALFGRMGISVVSVVVMVSVFGSLNGV